MKMNQSKKWIINSLFICLYVLVLCSISASAQEKQIKSSKNKTNTVQSKGYTYTIVPGVNHTFGYEIYLNGKLHIQQLSIPTRPGNEGFKLKKDAEKIAKIVVSKLQRGEFPPTVTEKDIKGM